MKEFPRRILAVVMASSLFTSVVFAGGKTTYQVNIVDTGAKPFATGDLGYVRNTADPNQYIGCETTTILASCYAVNAAGLYKSCSTTDPAMIALVHSLNGDSNLYFSWNASGTCLVIRVRNDSLAAPK
jgi:hypothetical protein